MRSPFMCTSQSAAAGIETGCGEGSSADAHQDRIHGQGFRLSGVRQRQLQLVWGVRPLVAPGEVEHLDGVIQTVDRQLQGAGLAHPGDRIIVLMGHPIRERPRTNLLRVHRVRSLAEWERTRP